MMRMHHFHESPVPVFGQIRAIGSVKIIRPTVDPRESWFLLFCILAEDAPAPSRFPIRRSPPASSSSDLRWPAERRWEVHHRTARDMLRPDFSDAASGMAH